MSRVVLDSVKGITVAQANRTELQPVAKLFRIKNPSSIDHDSCAMSLDEVVGREGCKLVSLGYDDAAVSAGQAGRDRVCVIRALRIQRASSL